MIESLSDGQTNSSSKDCRCEKCGLIFETCNDKDEHMKLEHDEHRTPSGVG